MKPNAFTERTPVYNRLLIPSALCLAILSTARSQEIANPTPAHAASEQTGEAQPATSEEAFQADQPHKLPKIKTFPMQSGPYPEEGIRRHLEGRVLMEFGLDQSGKPVSVSILQAEADRVLRACPLANTFAHLLHDKGSSASSSVCADNTRSATASSCASGTPRTRV